MTHAAVLRVSAVGDLCAALPVLYSLRNSGRFATIDWIIDAAFAPLFAKIDGINLITIDKRQPSSWRVLRQRRYDVLCHLHPSFRANLIRCCCRAATVIGVDKRYASDGQRWFVDISADSGDTPQHIVDVYLATLAPLGVVPQYCFALPLPAAATDTARALLPDGDRPQVLINPAASDAHRYRTPPPLFWRHIIKSLLASGAAVTLFGVDSVAAQRTLAAVDDLSIHNIIGRTSLAEAAALIQAADLVISPDSAPVHLADALETPCLSLYAATNPAWTGPYQDRRFVINGYPAARKRFLSENADWRQRIHAPCFDSIDSHKVAEMALAIIG